MFCNILGLARLLHVYHMTEAVQAVAGTIMVFGALTNCALLHLVYNLKAAQMNV